MSLIVGGIHLIYTLLINFKVKPYQNALKIHRYVFFLEHLFFLTFLLLINLINLDESFDEDLLLLFIYGIVIFFIFINLLTAVRYYHEFRYG